MFHPTSVGQHDRQSERLGFSTLQLQSPPDRSPNYRCRVHGKYRRQHTTPQRIPQAHPYECVMLAQHATEPVLGVTP